MDMKGTEPLSFKPLFNFGYRLSKLFPLSIDEFSDNCVENSKLISFLMSATRFVFRFAV